jgi:hypothetical protein
LKIYCIHHDPAPHMMSTPLRRTSSAAILGQVQRRVKAEWQDERS